MGSDSPFSKGGEMFLGHRKVNLKLLTGWVKGKILLINVNYLLSFKGVYHVEFNKVQRKGVSCYQVWGRGVALILFFSL